MTWLEPTNGAGILPRFQSISPIVLLSIVSTIVTICFIILLVYLVRYTDLAKANDDYRTQMPRDLEGFFLLLKDWAPDEYKTLLATFLLHDEYLVLEILLSCLEEDGLASSITNGIVELEGDGGWRNRNRIARRTSLSNRRIYGKNGIIERLIKLELIQERTNPKPWGREFLQYRANISHPLVKSMFHALNNQTR